jgi:hypothetical protein
VTGTPISAASESQPRLRPQWTGLLPAAGALAVLAVLAGAAFAAGRPNDARWTLVGLYAGMWAAFAVAVPLLRRARGGGAVALVVAGGIALQAVALTAPPRSTDDYYRYAWDGTVQAAGTDPYRYAPIDPALAALRTDWLFPPRCRRPVAPCTLINHPGSRTIYPPVAQAEFLAVHLLTPAGWRDRSWQVVAALLAVLSTLALVAVLRRAGRDPRWAALWAWCPTVVIEAGNAAHVDVLGVLLVVAGLAAVAAGRAGPAGRAFGPAVLGGALLGAAVGVKVLPALVLPAVLRRRGTVVAATAAAVLALSYLPHVLAVGPQVLGYLPGYLREEGYDGGGRFPVIRLLGVPDTAAPFVAVVVLLAVAVAVARRTDPDRPWDGAVVVTGTALLVAGPSYPWYALLLVGLVALSGRWEWLAVAAAGYPPYLVGALHLPPEPTKMAAYTAGAALTVLFGILRTPTGRLASSAALRSSRAVAPKPLDPTRRCGP